MALQCVTTCSSFIIISQTEYSFLSQQSVMSVRKRAGFPSPNQISALVWDSESKEAGASCDSIIYLGNRILCIFRPQLKYLCFSYSFLDGIRKFHDKFLIPHHGKHTGIDNACQYTGTKLNNIGLSRFMTVSGVNNEWCAEKSC